MHNARTHSPPSELLLMLPDVYRQLPVGVCFCARVCACVLVCEGALDMLRHGCSECVLTVFVFLLLIVFVVLLLECDAEVLEHDEP